MQLLADRAGKGIGLSFQVAAEVPQTLLGHSGGLRQVLINLLGNAVKFTSRGEVSVGVGLESRTDGGLVVRLRRVGYGDRHSRRQTASAVRIV